MNVTDQRCLVNNLQAEADGAALYRALAALESGSELATVYGRMAKAEIITGRSSLLSGLRQVLFGVVAAAITCGVGDCLIPPSAGNSRRQRPWEKGKVKSTLAGWRRGGITPGTSG